jgi:hypothetical protein
MPHAARRAQRLGAASALALAGAVLSACPHPPENSTSPPGVNAVLIGFPAGAPLGLAGAVVDVLNPGSGAPMADAAVSVNGFVLPWDPVNRDHEAALDLLAGAPVRISVSVGGETYHATVPFFDAGPTIQVTSPAPSGCENPIAWSGGAPAGTGPSIVGVLDAGNPNASPIFGTTFYPPGDGEIAVPPNALTPGDRLAYVGISRTFPFPGALEGSRVILVGGSLAPLTVVDADFREITVSPTHRGLKVGETLQLQAIAAVCGAFGGLRDVTATATWSSSDPAALDVGNAVTAGLATGTGNGTAEIAAELQGVHGSTILGSRAFTARDSTVPDQMLEAVTLAGTTIVAVGTSGVVVTSLDGETWTARSTGTSADLTSIASSADVVVMTQYGTSTVFTSSDLVTWTPRDAGPSAASGLSSIIWTGDEFVAVGGAIVTSTDGASWTARAPGTPYWLSGVAQGGAQLVAVGGYGGLVGQVVTSQDGVTWTEHDLTTAGFLRAVTHDGARFVAVGDNSTFVSSDGTTWTATSGPAGMAAVATSPGERMAVGPGGIVATTADDNTWFTWKVGDFGLTGVTWTGTQWVIVGAYGTIYTAP